MTRTLRSSAVVSLFSAFVATAIAVVPAAADDRPLTALDEQGRIAEINAAIEAAGADWMAGRTSLSGLSSEQLDAMFPGDMCQSRAEAIYETLRPTPKARSMRYPDVWDWREMNGVTPPKNQAFCGSCWAHAGCAATESHVLINEGVELDLSEQQAIDCNFQGGGCNGGLGYCARLVFEIHETIGAASEDCYPYEAADGVCHHCDCPKVAYIDGYETVPWTVDDLKYALYNYGPIPVGIAVYQDYGAYSGGCYEHVTGDLLGGHVILCVGWDMTRCGGEGAWIIKNHSGTGWGDGGFAYIKMPWGNCDFGGCGLRPLNAHIPRSHQVPGDYSTIQAAVDNSARGDTIKVAAGTYGPVDLQSTRILLGGYDPTFSVRDPELYPTTIDGGGLEAIDDAGDYGDCHVIDGFRITASSTFSAPHEAVHLSGREITLRNCEIYGSGVPAANEHGAQLYMDWGLGGAAIRIEDCVFRDLAGTAVDLPMCEDNATITVTGSLFIDNTTGIDQSDVTHDLLTTIDGNTMIGNSGCAVEFQVYNSFNCLCDIKNNIITGNGTGLRNWMTDNAWIAYNDVWGNGSNYLDCTPDTSCISLDPVFCDSAGGDYTLHGTSPCLGTGEDGVDMGAYGIGCPTGPTNFATSHNGACIDLTWDPPAWRNEVDHYVIYRAADPMPTTVLATVPAGQTSYSDLTIPPCEECYYAVTCIDTSDLEGVRSDEQSIELCYGAVNLDAALGGAGNYLSWSAAGGPLAYYTIERGSEPALLDSVMRAGASDTSCIDYDTADCPRDYHVYRVVPVYDTGWEGMPSNVDAVDPAPSPPSNITTEWSGTDGVLTWSPNCESDFDYWRVYRDVVPLPPPVNPAKYVGVANDTTYVDHGLNPSIVYFYRLVSVDETNHASGYSDMAYLGTGSVLAVPSPYATIQAAINAASAIDTVLVSPGTYPENIALKDGVIVVADGSRDAPVITSPSGTIVSSVGLSDLTLLRGFVIDGQGTAQYGLDCWESYTRVEDCTFRSCTNGANFKLGDKSTLLGNTFTLDQYGIATADSARPFLIGNTFDDNAFADISVGGGSGPKVGETLSDANDFLNHGYFQVINMGSGTVDADYNWWGDMCPDPGLFMGSVNYTPWTDDSHSGAYFSCSGVPESSGQGEPFASQSFPNPFNPKTALRYTVPNPGADVRIEVFDLAGRRIRTLAAGHFEPGEHTTVWDGRDEMGRELPSGVYFCRAAIGEYEARRKLVLLK